MLRNEDEVLREVLTFVPEGGARGRGRPRLRFYDTVKSDLKECGYDIATRNHHDFWERVKAIANNRQDWRKIVVR